MSNLRNNYAFIDSQNVNLSILALGWRINHKRFRKYLDDKYGITKAFLFIGYVEGNSDLYTALQEAGFICIFKPTLRYKNGTTKGNCDAELVLHTMIEYPNFEKAVVITGDGDFYCLVKYLIETGKLEAVLVPNRNRFSALLKFKLVRPFLRYMNDLSEKIGRTKEKTP